MAIDEAREKTTVSHVPVAFAITIELIENVWNLLGHLISHGCLSDKKSWRHRCFRLPPYIAAGSLWLTIGKPAWLPCANPTPCKQSNNQGNHQTTDPKTSFPPGRRFSLVFSSIFSHDGSFLFPQLFPQRGTYLSTLTKIRFQHILLHHSVGIEKGAIEGNGMKHHVNETISIMIEKRDNGLFQFIVKGRGIF